MIIKIPNKLYTLSVSSSQVDAGNTNMYSVGFRNLIENHLNVLRFLTNTRSVAIETKKEQIYTGDFYGLLHDILNVPQDLWWICMRMNNLESPLDYSGSLNVIVIPARQDIENLLNRFLNSTTM
jgi:hypothetical protein